MAKPNRREITSWLSLLLMRDVFHVPSDERYYWSSEVTLANKLYSPGKTQQIRPDFIQFIPINQTSGGLDRGEFRVFEIKSCMADFNNDHGHNMIGDKNYYVMTQGLYDELCSKHGMHRWRRCSLTGSKAGVYIVKPGDDLSDESWDKFYRDFPYLGILNPYTGKRDLSSLKCIASSDTNLKRNYSNTELLFAMLRSAGRDRTCYSLDFWNTDDIPSKSKKG